MKAIIETLFLLSIFINSLISYGQQKTEEGYIIPVRGEIKVLLVWARVVDAITNPAPFGGHGMGQLPTDANEFFDPTFTPGIEPTAYLTKYFYEQSFGQYIVTGDYLNHVLEVTLGNRSLDNRINSYNKICLFPFLS